MFRLRPSSISQTMAAPLTIDSFAPFHQSGSQMVSCFQPLSCRSWLLMDSEDEATYDAGGLASFRRFVNILPTSYFRYIEHPVFRGCPAGFCRIQRTAANEAWNSRPSKHHDLTPSEVQPLLHPCLGPHPMLCISHWPRRRSALCISWWIQITDLQTRTVIFLMDQNISKLTFSWINHDQTFILLMKPYETLGVQHDLLGQEFPTEVLREWAIFASESERLKRDMTQPSPWGWVVLPPSYGIFYGEPIGKWRLTIGF